MCQQAQIAIKSYIYCDYELFDAQVSENLCQIRAYQLSTLVERNLDLIRELTLISIEIKSLQIRCRALLNQYKTFEENRPSHYIKEIDMSILLIKYLEENHLNIPIKEELSFLIQTYILSYYKLVDEHEISDGVDYQRLSNDLVIGSKTFIRKFVHHLQRKVSEMSCDFIFKLLYELDAQSNQIFLTASLYAKDQDSRHIIGCYEVMKIILEHAHKNKKMICVNIIRIFGNEKDSITFILIPRLMLWISNNTFK